MPSKKNSKKALTANISWRDPRPNRRSLHRDVNGTSLSDRVAYFIRRGATTDQIVKHFSNLGITVSANQVNGLRGAMVQNNYI